ncbi:MAG: 1-deoxy-D-xylulose-5-phosphate synthase, partial [Proteobacteria bacterium]|nr:1-deoxy-D-xylulose-5-phosphate synthase [Pseudomonadota bacterium]
AVRYPRGTGLGVPLEAKLDGLTIGKAEIRRQRAETNSPRVALLAFGSMLAPALAAAAELDATVANMRFVKPLDGDLVKLLAESHDLLVSLEENALIGGAGAEIARCLEQLGLTTPLLRLGLPDRFIDHGDSAKLLAQLGLNAAGIVTSVKEAFKKNS